MVVVLAVVALVLARLRLTPLSAPPGSAWASASRPPRSRARRSSPAGSSSSRRDAGGAMRCPAVVQFVQVALVLWTLVAAWVLFDALRVGLLGYPDLMVVGNGSTPDMLRWYVDRFHATPEASWVVSVPVLAYRLAMLAWALWMATALLKWVRWAWTCYSEGGHWRSGPGRQPAPKSGGPGRSRPAAPGRARPARDFPQRTGRFHARGLALHARRGRGRPRRPT